MKTHHLLYQKRTYSSRPEQIHQSSRNAKRSSLFPIAGLTLFLVAGLGIKQVISQETDISLVEKSTALEQKHRESGEELPWRKFFPYTVTRVENITPTTFVLTVKAHASQNWSGTKEGMKHHYLSVDKTQWSWRFPLWSVDIKEPNVQIARHFTPLPPLGCDIEDDELKLYIRTFGNGEMSRYLERLKPGDTIEMRGPHPGFDVTRRLGMKKDLVFLAGGTGIAPGLQAAQAVLGGDTTSQVTLLWAVRSIAETKGLNESDLLKGERDSSWLSGWFGQPRSAKPILSDGETPIAHHINRL